MTIIVNGWELFIGGMFAAIFLLFAILGFTAVMSGK
jgi:hypothetical protein